MINPNGNAAPTVIPAKAGIQNPGHPRRIDWPGVDSRFRGNDGYMVRANMTTPKGTAAPTVIPAPAGIQNPSNSPA